jgi:hypothetical protein
MGTRVYRNPAPAARPWDPNAAETMIRPPVLLKPDGPDPPEPDPQRPPSKSSPRHPSAKLRNDSTTSTLAQYVQHPSGGGRSRPIGVSDIAVITAGAIASSAERRRLTSGGLPQHKTVWVNAQHRRQPLMHIRRPPSRSCSICETCELATAAASTSSCCDRPRYARHTSSGCSPALCQGSAGSNRSAKSGWIEDKRIPPGRFVGGEPCR